MVSYLQLLILARLPALAALEICAILTRFQLLQFSSFAQQGHSKTKSKYIKRIYTTLGF